MPLEKKPAGLKSEELERRMAPVRLSTESAATDSGHTKLTPVNSPPCLEPESSSGDGEGRQEIPQS